MRTVSPSDPYMENFDGYLEQLEDDSSLFRDSPVLVPTPEQKPISSELLWYLDCHSKGDNVPKNALKGLTDLPSVPHANCRTTDIWRLLDTKSQQASTQTEPFASPVG